MRILFVEPFCGGSHRQFAEAFCRLSSHDVRLLSLPASFWKWRMRGGHLSLLEKVLREVEGCDGLLASDMLSLAELAGLVPALGRMAKVVYFHENQLSYPVPKGESPDVHFGFTNLSTALAADRLIFNSNFHREEFLGGIAPFLAAMPDHRPGRLAERLRKKAAVVYPGIDCEALGRDLPAKSGRGDLAILWNHRWEFDKGPEIFFGALRRLVEEGIDFRVRLLGENFQVKPKPFLEAREFLGERLVDFGYLEKRADYIKALRSSDVVVSTARQEFYGIAVLEGAYCGCRPLLPDRLSYRELFPEEYLYGSDEEFYEKLRSFIRNGLPQKRGELHRKIAEVHDIRRTVPVLDGLLEEAAEIAGPPRSPDSFAP